jgi:hypothetical protein
VAFHFLLGGFAILEKPTDLIQARNARSPTYSKNCQPDRSHLPPGLFEHAISDRRAVEEYQDWNPGKRSDSIEAFGDQCSKQEAML